MAATTQNVPIALKGGVGAYKDFQNMNVNHEAELKGTDKFAAASFPEYLPVWSNEQGKK
jgi:hypothetical protein